MRGIDTLGRTSSMPSLDTFHPATGEASSSQVPPPSPPRALCQEGSHSAVSVSLLAVICNTLDGLQMGRLDEAIEMTENEVQTAHAVF